MIKRSSNCAICENTNRACICSACVNHSIMEYNTLLKSLKTRRDTLYSRLSELLESKGKADDQKNWRLLQNEKLFKLKNKRKCNKEQVTQGRAKIERESCNLKVKYGVLDSARSTLEKIRVEQVEKYFPNLICTQSLGLVSVYQNVNEMLKSKTVSFVQPVHYKYQITSVEAYEQDRQFEPPELPDESQSFTMHEIAEMRGLQSYENAGKEEVQSAISETYVSVANYKVRMSVSAKLQTIIDKQGDIAASSKLQSTSTRSFYLESLAAALMELRSTALRDLTKTRVAEIAAVVKDMDSVKIDVSWLKTTVTELAEAVEYLEKYDTAKMVKEECDKEMTAGKVEMEELKEELRRREKETKECRERVTAMAGRLGQLEMKDVRVKKNLKLFESKVHNFDGQAVLVHL